MTSGANWLEKADQRKADKQAACDELMRKCRDSLERQQPITWRNK